MENTRLKVEKQRNEAERQRIEAEKQRVERIAYEKRIMMMNTSGMTPEVVQYYTRLKMQILHGDNV